MNLRDCLSNFRAKHVPINIIDYVDFKSKKELNYDRFVDLNILGNARLYKFIEFYSL